MRIVFAGKSNALVFALRHAMKYMQLADLYVIPVASDLGNDDWQYSITKFCDTHRLQKITLEQAYTMNDMTFISIQYDKILKPSKFVTKRLYNIHFSYLPYYKGVFPTVWPIFNQEEFSGVTLHIIDEGIDTGNIVEQRKIFLYENITAHDLYYLCQEEAFKIFVNNFKIFLSDTLIFSKQQPKHIGSYFSKTSLNLSKHEIDLNKTASEISATIRALNFREYQLPVVFGKRISGVTILATKSDKKPGSLITQSDTTIEIASVDFNLLLKIDYADQLFQACASGDFEMAVSIIGFIDDLEITNSMGWTFLMIAAYNSHFNLVRLLIEKGANVNASTYKGTTVLMYAKSTAAKTDNMDILNVLLENGALVDVKDAEGKYLLEYALEEGNTKVCSLLISHSTLLQKLTANNFYLS